MWVDKNSETLISVTISFCIFTFIVVGGHVDYFNKLHYIVATFQT